MAGPTEYRRALIHDPPYRHQAAAIEATVSDGRRPRTHYRDGLGQDRVIPSAHPVEAGDRVSDSAESFGQPSVRAVLLYPMNALVNDQLGRLRLFFGDAAVSGMFMEWSNRPARFARYTSRTPYPGVRTTEKDQDRLRPIGEFYVDLMNRASDSDDPDADAAAHLLESLQVRGKWPAKPDLRSWYGRPGQRWQDRQGDTSERSCKLEMRN